MQSKKSSDKQRRLMNFTFSFNNRSTLLILLILYVLTYRRREIYLNICLLSSLLFNYRIFYSCLRSSKRLILTVKLCFYLICIYWGISIHNPLNYLLFFWIPFQNFFKGILIVRIVSFLLTDEYTRLNSEDKSIQIETENNSLLCDLFAFLSKRKRKAAIILLTIKIIGFIVDDKYSHLMINKQDLVKDQKYFIAANLFNNENILEDWTEQMTQLVDYLGHDKVFISIFENGDSNDKTQTMLMDFQRHLRRAGISHNIVVEKTVEKGTKKRIEFLAILRNYALQPLYNLNWDLSTTKILFFNDIIFTYTDIIKLISTNKQNYDIACGLDFYDNFYDSWVSTGVDGAPFRDGFPYFINSAANNRVIDGENVRIFACWNGVAVIKAKPFVGKAIKFRYGKKINKSECTFLAVDFWESGYNKIILNPNYKFAYEYRHYYLNKYVYPFSKDVMTYFYYYFRYFFVASNRNFENISDNNVELDSEWAEYVKLLKDV